MKSLRIVLYGNFGAGNLGNECTLQAVIEQISRFRPDAELQCLCTDPDDVQRRHRIPAFRASLRGAPRTDSIGTGPVPTTNHVKPARPNGFLGRVLRLLFIRLPLEFAQWLRMLRLMWRTDMLIVAGTGIVADYMCGPLGWPYDMFKLSVLAAVCRVKVVFLSVGVGPINHPLSRVFIKTSLRLATFRSYRDETSKRYLDKIGFGTERDIVYPDVVFGLAEHNLKPNEAGAGRRRIIGLGLKDYSGVMGRLETAEYRQYLDTMAAFVAWLTEHGYGVRLLIGDFQYDSRVRDEFAELLKSRNVLADSSMLIAEPSLTVEELLRQLGETDVVISPRYHNLVMAMMLNKPVMALSDHSKLDALLTDIGLAQYLVPLQNLRADDLIARFERLDADAERVKSHIRGKLDEYRRALDTQYASLFPESARP